MDHKDFNEDLKNYQELVLKRNENEFMEHLANVQNQELPPLSDMLQDLEDQERVESVENLVSSESF